MSWKYFGFIAPIYISIILAGKCEMVILGQIVATNTVHKPQHSFVVLKLFIFFVRLGLLLLPAWDTVRSMLSFGGARGHALEMLWFPPMEFF